MNDNRKVVLVGTGFVGMSYAYALLNQNACDELVLVDINKEKAIGEAMDLNHGLAFSGANMKIYAGEYSDCKDADIVAIAAGVSQKPGESRPDLLHRNTKVFESILNPIVDSGFSGVFLIATNPVDVMTRITYKLTGFESSKIIGTGTTLDSARLRYLLGEYFEIDPRSVHAYVIGEHGDSEFVPWSQAMIATKSILSICEEAGGKFCLEEMQKIGTEVRDAAGKIIKAKDSTYYGIGMSMARITKAIFGNENSVLTVSTKLDGEYCGIKDVFVGVPSIVNRSGVRSIITLPLSDSENALFEKSCDILQQMFEESGLK